MEHDEKLFKVEEQLKKKEEETINIKFDYMQRSIDSMQKSIDEIKEMLKESMKNSSENVKSLEDKIYDLELKYKTCPITDMNADLKNVIKETKFIRFIFGNGWRGVVILTTWIVLIFILLIVIGPKEVLEFMLKFKM